jgi:hypothetical protein
VNAEPAAKTKEMKKKVVRLLRQGKRARRRQVHREKSILFQQRNVPASQSLREMKRPVNRHKIFSQMLRFEADA